MNRFLNALQTKNALTENGMPTHSSSGSKVLDLFFRIGASRGLHESAIVQMFSGAFSEDPLLTTKCLFYNRDIRGGQGERRSFRIMFTYLCNRYPEVARMNLSLVPFYGRWDDVFSALDTPVEDDALDLIAFYLKKGDALCAKWMPRENKKNGQIARKLMTYMGITPRSYRRLLAGNTDVVETFMCQNLWSEINYNHVPSVASKNYRGAFRRHDADRYSEWIASLSKPESGNKIHADAIFPHSIVTSYISTTYRAGIGRLDSTLEAQWKALPDYVPDGKSFIPVCDLSGSMRGEAMAVSASLGVYLSQRNKGPFKDAFITFSRIPALQYLSGNLHDRLVQMNLEAIAENTNLEAVFRLILTYATKAALPNEEMPSTILIISDMQFDSSLSYPSATGMEMIRKMYISAGYSIPNVVFWNVRTSTGVPVKMNEIGVSLVSGFSPSIMKSVLSGEMTPMGIMLKTLNSDRYAGVTV